MTETKSDTARRISELRQELHAAVRREADRRRVYRRRDVQDETRDAATHHQESFAADELAILADPAVSHKAAAALLCRSFYAARSKRERMAGKK